jgi:hypothetical protein
MLLCRYFGVFAGAVDYPTPEVCQIGWRNRKQNVKLCMRIYCTRGTKVFINNSPGFERFVLLFFRENSTKIRLHRPLLDKATFETKFHNFLKYENSCD